MANNLKTPNNKRNYSDTDVISPSESERKKSQMEDQKPGHEANDPLVKLCEKIEGLTQQWIR